MEDTLFNKGSEWRKWDLHFHTPSSYDYKNKSITDNEIVETLIQNEIAVVAITDHHIIDIPRIKNIQKISKDKGLTVLPGIEFCSDMRGNEPIHFIAIFSENSNIEFIWNEINSKAKIAEQRVQGKKDNEIYCDLIDTCKLINELGGIISIHSGSKQNSIEVITNKLPVKMAQKRDIVKNINIFEIGNIEDQEEYINCVFPKIGILPMIMCSDNHNVKDYSVKCSCWIKADPTFEGLKQIIFEPSERAFIGEKPYILENVENNKTKYIKSLHIKQINDYKEEYGIWFKDVIIEFNKELIAIIGNKGSGKSAISDILGLLGDTHNSGENNSNFSFLSKNKFLKKGYAENFEAELLWEDESSNIKNLSNEIDLTQNEKVKYLPQNYFESITNEINGKGFTNTLKGVIFNHIPKDLRYGKFNFDELEEYRSSSINKDLILLNNKIKSISSEIIDLEKRRHPNNLQTISNLLVEKEKELKIHIKTKPKEVKAPPKDKSLNEQLRKKLNDIDDLFNKLEELNNQIEEKQIEKQNLVDAKEDLQQLLDDIERFENEINEYKKTYKKRFLTHGIDIESIIKFATHKQSIKKKIISYEKQIKNISILLKPFENIEKEFKTDKNKIDSAMFKSLLVKSKNIQSKINDLKKELSKPEKEYQTYKEKLRSWNEKYIIINGDAKHPSKYPNTIEFYKSEIMFITSQLQTELDEKRNQRLKTALNIFNKKKEILALYESFKNSIDNVISKDNKFLDKFNMEITDSFKLKNNFYDKFLSFVNKNKKGSFYGILDGEKNIRKIFEEKELNEENNIEIILKSIIEYLENDKRAGIKEKDKSREISEQIDQLDEFYEYIFSLEYLEPIYELKLDNKSLDELSPGEKGALLLVFYLMIDKETIPLIIDQPEDNLDNQSVFKILTHFIKAAKKRRQVIIVTHNPNIAIGADAEQIIYVNIEKNNNYNFKYMTGSIEFHEINKHIVDILEGTMPAFDKRKLKYFNEQ